MPLTYVQFIAVMKEVWRAELLSRRVTWGHRKKSYGHNAATSFSSYYTSPFRAFSNILRHTCLLFTRMLVVINFSSDKRFGLVETCYRELQEDVRAIREYNAWDFVCSSQDTGRIIIMLNWLQYEQIVYCEWHNTSEAVSFVATFNKVILCLLFVPWNTESK